MNKKEIKTVTKGVRMPAWVSVVLPKVAKAIGMNIDIIVEEAFSAWLIKNAGREVIAAMIREEVSSSPEMARLMPQFAPSSVANSAAMEVLAGSLRSGKLQQSEDKNAKKTANQIGVTKGKLQPGRHKASGTL